jgi:hypothetical protein
MRFVTKLVLVVTILALPLTPALAIDTYFGEDLGLGEGTPLPAWPNADAAEAAFLLHLIGVGVEDFEGYADGTTAPLPITFSGSGVTATLQGNGEIDDVPMGSTNGFGRYATSGTHYWESSDVFTIDFDQPIAAFGFFGIDIGDFEGQVTLTCTDGTNIVLVIPHTVDGDGGSVIFFGFIDEDNQYTSISFGNTEPGSDYFGFDDMYVGTIYQIADLLDIKPTSCPNPFNTKAQGKLPVALLGTDLFDVMDVDPTTLLLEGVAPLRYTYEDVAAPYIAEPGEDPCACGTEGPDGYMDLVMHFDRQAIYATMGTVTDGEMRELTLTLMTYSGIALDASDCVWIKHKVKDPTPPPRIFTRTFTGSGTEVSLTLSEAADVSLVVYDVRGKKVRTLVNGALPGGNHTIRWNGLDDAGNTVADGMYFGHVVAGTTEQTSKMLLMR